VRWILKGTRGIHLEATRLGGKWITSAEALQRFADKLAAAQSVVAQPQSRQSRGAAAERAERELDQLGL
jgi:hypothetical protein